MALRKESRLRSLPPASEIPERDYDEPIKLRALQAPVVTGAPPPLPPPPHHLATLACQFCRSFGIIYRECCACVRCRLQLPAVFTAQSPPSSRHGAQAVPAAGGGSAGRAHHPQADAQQRAAAGGLLI